jgi:hypothetical protein
MQGGIDVLNFPLAASQLGKIWASRAGDEFLLKRDGLAIGQVDMKASEPYRVPLVTQYAASEFSLTNRR